MHWKIITNVMLMQYDVMNKMAIFANRLSPVVGSVRSWVMQIDIFVNDAAGAKRTIVEYDICKN